MRFDLVLRGGRVSRRHPHRKGHAASSARPDRTRKALELDRKRSHIGRARFEDRIALRVALVEVEKMRLVFAQALLDHSATFDPAIEARA